MIASHLLPAQTRLLLFLNESDKNILTQVSYIFTGTIEDLDPDPSLTPPDENRTERGCVRNLLVAFTSMVQRTGVMCSFALADLIDERRYLKKGWIFDMQYAKAIELLLDRDFLEAVGPIEGIHFKEIRFRLTDKAIRHWLKSHNTREKNPENFILPWQRKMCIVGGRSMQHPIRQRHVVTKTQRRTQDQSV